MCRLTAIISRDDPKGERRRSKNPFSAADLVERRFGLGRGDLPDIDVPEADLRAVGLQLDRTARDERLGPIEEVVEDLAVDGGFVVEPDPDARADHLDPEGIPFADR